MATSTAADPVRVLVDRLYRALRDQDLGTLRTLLADDIRAQLDHGLPYGLGDEPLVGAEALMRDGWGRIAELLRIVPYPEEVRTAGDWVVVRGRYLGSVRSTGRPLDARFAHFWRVAEGRLVRLRQVTDAPAWWRALTPGATAGR